jgi:hypothetical protein
MNCRCHCSCYLPPSARAVWWWPVVWSYASSSWRHRVGKTTASDPIPHRRLLLVAGLHCAVGGFPNVPSALGKFSATLVTFVESCSTCPI